MPTKSRPLVLTGYFRVEQEFAEFEPSPGYVAILEDLDRNPSSGRLVIPEAGNSKKGMVLSVHPSNAHGLTKGDIIVYEEWQGGRWSFLDSDSMDGVLRCLIMGTEHVLARMEV